MRKKYDRKWRGIQLKWRRRDSQIIEKLHVYLAHRKMCMAHAGSHVSQTSKNRRTRSPGRPLKRRNQPAIISASQHECFRLNRHHPLWLSLPITWFNGKRPPNWENLSLWCKVQLALIAMSELGCVLITGKLSSALETKLVTKGVKDITGYLRNRLRDHLRSITGVENPEFLFVLEGHTKGKVQKTDLHIHGVIATDRLPAEPLRTNMVKEAVARTVGQWRRGKIGYRAVHTQPYSRTGSGYGNYILKHVTRRDDRMGDHRVAFSKSMKAGTREFWLAVSGLDGTRKVPRNARRVARNSFAGKIVHARRATRKRVSARVSESSRLRHAIKRLAKAAQAASTSP